VGVKALAGLRVVECGAGVAAAYAAKLFADLGADVIKIEPPAGDYTRLRGPFPGETPDRERSGLFTYLNAGKRSATLCLERDGDQQRFERLLAPADVLIHNLQPGSPVRAALDPETLLRAHPRLVIADITGFGRSGVNADFQWTDLIALCAGGLAYICAAERGRPDRSPLKPFGEQAEFQAAITAAVAIMGALRARREQGFGQWIDISAQETITAMLGTAMAQYTYTGAVPTRLGVRSIHPWAFMPCQDGLILIFCVENAEWQRLVELLGNPEWAGWEIFQDRFDRAANWDVLQPLLAEAVGAWTVRDLYEAGQQHRIPLAPVATMADLLASPQLTERRYFASYETPAGESFLMPGRPFTLSATPWELGGRAPKLGEHNDAFEALCTDVASEPMSTRTIADAQPTERRAPLAGVRVLDFTWVWAGPFAAMQLAHLGAEVIKVESQKRLDTTRRFVPFADGEAGVNRSGYFNQYNQGKRSVLLNLSEPEGRALAQRLALSADIVIDNFAPGAMQRFGLDQASLGAINPRIITVSLTGYGEDGPESRFMSYGPSQEPLAGLSALSGYRDGPPGDLGLSYGDPNAGIHAAFAAQAALWHRDRSGAGQHVEVSLLESSINVIPEGIIEQTMNGFPPPRAGARDRWMSPHGTFPCSGEDAWLGIAVRDNHDFARFATAIGMPQLARDPRFRTLHGRKANEDDLEGLVCAWTATQDRFAAAEVLQRAGVPAFPCMTAADLHEDRHIRERDFFVRLEHPEVGARAHPGVPWKLSATPMRVQQPAPLLGEATRELLARILNIDDATYDDLVRRNIVF
jgi:crotonobetainyl-CoA:carnitine CoA-transferase CaiB-like acyl-CoA transferase